MFLQPIKIKMGLKANSVLFRKE